MHTIFAFHFIVERLTSSVDMDSIDMSDSQDQENGQQMSPSMLMGAESETDGQLTAEENEAETPVYSMEPAVDGNVQFVQVSISFYFTISTLLYMSCMQLEIYLFQLILKLGHMAESFMSCIFVHLVYTLFLNFDIVLKILMSLKSSEINTIFYL